MEEREILTTIQKKYRNTSDIDKDIKEIDESILELDDNSAGDREEKKRLIIEKKILLEKKETFITFDKNLTPATSKRKFENVLKSTNKDVTRTFEKLNSLGKKGDIQDVINTVGSALMKIIILDQPKNRTFDDLISFLERIKEIEKRENRKLGNLVDQEVDGETPLYVAINLNKKDCARVLLDYGASLTIENKSTGLTPLELAFKNKSMNSEIYIMILSMGEGQELQRQ